MPILIDEDNQKAWIAVAHSTRINERILSRIGDPLPGSNFAKVAELYPFERVADRARAYLRAGLDHLVMWADFAAPFKFHQDQVLNFTLRPTYTLSRAAIEASAQAVWLMDTRDPKECIRRHLSLMRWDLNEHHRSKKGDPGEQAMIDIRRRELVSRVSAVFQPEDIAPPRGYLQVIKDACSATGLDLDAETAERLWTAASGAAHGKYWTNRDLQTVHVGEEYEPGQHRTVQIPDPAAMTEVLEAANTITGYGVLRFADYSGVNIQSFMDEAVAWLAQNIPLRDEAYLGEMDRLPALIDRRSQGQQEP
ncbi:MAG: hypothetical protein JWN95_2687 [Frankiales bacterium]|nr:hypothetical protein [Frankiales bacterium]